MMLVSNAFSAVLNALWIATIASAPAVLSQSCTDCSHRRTASSAIAFQVVMSPGLPYDFSPMRISLRKPEVDTTLLRQEMDAPEP
ncbi:hypothetical protein SHKM778_18650 [Streptomyces sp. KM77-8]|uniref:Secreted protein n=1 Tax=Streptomyces haneummycinicus TaxID=3074435 RepID=A0AAT9HDG3_9ACTN